MRTYPEDEYELKEVSAIRAELWQLDLLKLNPSYVHWGPHEDYMWNEKDGWDGRKLFKSWEEFGPWELDELNEVVHFYFEIERENKECVACEGSGLAPESKKISDAFYSHSCPPGMEPWNDKITQDEVEALVKHGRLRDFTHEFVAGEGWKEKNPPYMPTAAEVNELQNTRGKMLASHDAINRWILIETRCKRLGLPYHCTTCNGDGIVYTAEKSHTNLILWVLHPRKGCSRGVEVRIEQKDLPAVFLYLRNAAKRNEDRFSKII